MGTPCAEPGTGPAGQQGQTHAEDGTRQSSQKGEDQRLLQDKGQHPAAAPAQRAQDPDFRCPLKGGGPSAHETRRPAQDRAV